MIESLIYGMREFDEWMPFKIMGSLPAQQVTWFFNLDSHDLVIPAVNLAIHQHLTILWALRFLEQARYLLAICLHHPQGVYQPGDL